MDKDKPLDAMTTPDSPGTPPQSPEEKKLAMRVQELFTASYNTKNQLRKPDIWKKCDDYKHNRQNPPKSDIDPGSVTNIIHSIIEAMIADLVDKPISVEAKGHEPSDHVLAEQSKHMLEFVLNRNRIKLKLNQSEHDRLELGTTILKVYFDHDALGGRGLPIVEPISPANFFPDPKVQSSHLLQEGEFMIHAVPRPLSWFRKQWPERGKYVQREISVPYNPEIFEDQGSDETEVTTSQKALLLECYMKDNDGSTYCLHVANHILLEDSRKVLDGKKVNRRDHFPFVLIPCYIQRGQIWGQSDIEMLIPTQDIINEMDDNIRITARLMGNPQVVVGMGAGRSFDYRKWTNMPGLRIPMRDINAWRIVEPSGVSADIINRREKGFQEANLISGRTDLTTEQTYGAVRAASAIIAVQQQGQKGVNHKAEMFKTGWGEVLELLMDEIITNWDTEMWFRIEGEKPDFRFYDPSRLSVVPQMIPDQRPVLDENNEPVFGLDGPEMEHFIKPLEDEEGNQMTREVQLDLSLSMGNGLPSDKAFMYQTVVELSKAIIDGRSVITWKEFREYLRGEVGLPLDDDANIPQPQLPGMPGQPTMPGQIPGQMPIPNTDNMNGQQGQMQNIMSSLRGGA